MSFKFDNNIPIYIQLVEQLKINIISGKIKAGERIPSVRELAKKLQVNPNTMQKALTELEELKLIYTESTNGKYVTKDQKLIKKYKDRYAKEIAKNFFSSMKSVGYEEFDAIDYLQKLEGEK